MTELLKPFIPYPIIKLQRYLLRKIEAYRFKGNVVQCPVCRASFSRFAAYRPSGRKNARCINCRSLGRQRMQFLYLQQRTDLFNDKIRLRMLHFAPEKPLYDKLVKQSNLEYITCDMSPRSHDFREIKGIQKVDITNIPFGENSFDVILCSHVLEHIEDDRLAMRELYRVMTPGGWGIFQVPMRYRFEKTYEDFSIRSPKGRKKAFGQYDHVMLYGQDYAERLKDAGFAVFPDRYASSFSEKDILRFGINPHEIIFLCKKLSP